MIVTRWCLHCTEHRRVELRITRGRVSPNLLLNVFHPIVETTPENSPYRLALSTSRRLCTLKYQVNSSSPLSPDEGSHPLAT